MPNAGVYWVGDSLFVLVKWFAGQRGMEYYARHQTRQGWFERPNQKKLADEMEFVFAGSSDRWSQEYTGTERRKGFGHALVHRARWCWPEEYGGKNELARFDREDFKPLAELLAPRFATPSPISPFDRYKAQEKVLLFQSIETTGVYVRQHHRNLNEVYVGQSGQVDERKHSGKGTFLVRVWPTTCAASAKVLERTLQDALVGSGRVQHRQGRDYFILYPQFDGLEVLDGLMAQPGFRMMSHTTLGFPTRPTSPTSVRTPAKRRGA